MSMMNQEIEMTSAVDRLLGCETEIHLKSGEVLDGVPMEMSFASSDSPHLMFEESHGDYRWLDVEEIQMIRLAA